MWHKLERTKPTENRKLSSKFDGPWKITKLVESTHNLNVNLVHVNNPNVTRRTSIRKLKRAFLRPKQLPYIKENRPQDQLAPLQDITPAHVSISDDIQPLTDVLGPNKNKQGRTLAF